MTRPNEQQLIALSSKALSGGLSRRRNQAGKIGWALLWLLGVPLPVLLIFYLVRGH